MISGSSISTWHPRLRSYAALYLAGLIVFGGMAWIQAAPGYMDAEYYLATGSQIAAGRGWVEPFVWNFLANPALLPAPSHAYWMPLASLVAAASMSLIGNGFRAAQIAFVLIAAALPVVTAGTSVALRGGRQGFWLAGILALLPGLFAPYMANTDTFALFGVVGGAAFWLMAMTGETRRWILWLGIGTLIGLGHLARADGVLLWMPAIFVLVRSRGQRAQHAGLALAGYGLVMVPWLWRNLNVFGTILPPGTSRTLWLLNYDELFLYPADLLTPARWWASGIAAITSARLGAIGTNLQTVLAVNGAILLWPLAILGGWARRRDLGVQAAALYFASLFGAMSLVFPFAGARGGFFHSSTAVMPMLWSLTAIGVEVAAAAAPRWRWNADRSRTLFTVVALALAAGLSAWALWGKARSSARNLVTYRMAASTIQNTGPTRPSTVVAAVDPPGFFAASGVPAVALPDGDTEALRLVVERYGVQWVVIEADHPQLLSGLYQAGPRPDWLGRPVSIEDAAGKPVLLYPVEAESLP
jgi:hypothetical protein